MRVERFLTESADRHPGRTALVAGSKRLSYSEIDRASDNLAKALVLNNVRRRDRVVMFMGNCWASAFSRC
jgi:long-chain acyl-CoA synthetase